jgi:hypothetical protein
VNHVFADSLATSHAHADAPWWPIVYKMAFPTSTGTRDQRADGWAQRAGIDRFVDLSDGTSLKIDEKVRTKDYPDILLERWSSRESRTPGWIQKDLSCDFIAYAFIPTETCYLLPFQVLRRVWREQGREWIAKAEQKDKDKRHGFAVVEAENPTYTTESITVPIPVLLDAIRDALVIHWGRDT